MIGDKEDIRGLLSYFFAYEQSTPFIEKFNKEDPANIEYDEIKLAIVLSLENFLRRPHLNELKFPASFSNVEKKLVQIAAKKMGLKYQLTKRLNSQSTSSSSGPSTQMVTTPTFAIVVYKPNLSTIVSRALKLQLTWNSRRAIVQLLGSNPVTMKERQEFQQLQCKPDKEGRDDRHRTTTGKLMGAVPQVPQSLSQMAPLPQPMCSTSAAALHIVGGGDGLVSHQTRASPEPQQHAVWAVRAEIIESVRNNPIVIVFGAAGCGKTTQIAQMIMQDCGRSGKACRMICTQPYGLCAHANAQYVTQNRDENIGQTVGYQIRLESKVSPRTLLTYCTNEVLLRTLYGDRGFLAGTTHILVDELQQRCRHADLLVALLRSLTSTGGSGTQQHLRVVLLVTCPALPYDLVPTGPGTAGGRPSPRTSYFHRHGHQHQQQQGGSSPVREGSSSKLVRVLRHYFDYCPTVYVRKPVQDIEELFLEDVLHMVNIAVDSQDSDFSDPLQKATLEKWLAFWLERGTHGLNTPELGLFSLFYKPAGVSPSHSGPDAGIFSRYSSSGPTSSNSTGGQYCSQIDYVTIFDDILWSIFSRQDIEDVENEQDRDPSDPNSSGLGEGLECSYGAKPDSGQLCQNYMRLMFNLVSNDFISVNHRHRISGMTPLLVCSLRGFPQAVQRLLALGANPCLAVGAQEPLLLAYSAFLAQLAASGDSGLSTCLSLYHSLLELAQPPGLTGLRAADMALLSQQYAIFDCLLGYMMCSLQGLSLDTRHNFSPQQSSPSTGAKLPSPPSSGSSPSQRPLPRLDSCPELLYKTVVELLALLARNTDSGNILIFLPDFNHLVHYKTLLLQTGEAIFPKTFKYQIYLMHSKMMIQDLNSIVASPVWGVRKIILATAIAESCLNISDISFVIDCGFETKRVFEERFGTVTHKLCPISRLQAALRASKAISGISRVCFHLFSVAQYEAMADQRVPDILTYPLNEVVLQVKLLTAVGASVAQFLQSTIDPPGVDSVAVSIRTLRAIEALDRNEEITELGYHLYDFPIDPKYGKMVLYSVLLKCLDPILTISCILTSQDPFISVTSGKKYRELLEIKRKFSSNTFSDHMVLLRAFQFWQKSRAEGWENSFCQKNYLSSSALECIAGIRTRLLGQLRASGFVKARGSGDIRDLNANSENWAVVKAAIVAGQRPDLTTHFDKEHNRLLHVVGTNTDQILPHPDSVLHSVLSSPSSSLHGPASGCTHLFIFDQAMCLPSSLSSHSPSAQSHYDCHTSTKEVMYACCLTSVTPATLALMTPTVITTLRHVDPPLPDVAAGSLGSPAGAAVDNLDRDSDGASGRDSVNQSVSELPPDSPSLDVIQVAVTNDDELAQLLTRLRQKWQAHVMRKLKNPSKQSTNQDEAVLRSIVTVLTLEEQAHGLKQPTGVGARPRPMAPEYCNHSDTCLPHGGSPRQYVEHAPSISISSFPECGTGTSGEISNELGQSAEAAGAKLLTGNPSGGSGGGGQGGNQGGNQYFVIKLAQEQEMGTIMATQTYRINAQLKAQIEALLAGRFNIYLIFVSGPTHAVLGYGRVLQLLQSVAVTASQPPPNHQQNRMGQDGGAGDARMATAGSSVMFLLRLEVAATTITTAAGASGISSSHQDLTSSTAQSQQTVTQETSIRISDFMHGSVPLARQQNNHIYPGGTHSQPQQLYHPIGHLQPTNEQPSMYHQPPPPQAATPNSQRFYTLAPLYQMPTQFKFPATHPPTIVKDNNPGLKIQNFQQ